MRQSEFYVLLDRQMRKEREVLQNVSYFALGDGSVLTGRGVEQDTIFYFCAPDGSLP